MLVKRNLRNKLAYIMTDWYIYKQVNYKIKYEKILK